MTTETEIGIVEMGANHLKEIEFLCSIALPDFGYITNFGKAHLEGFGSIEGVIAAKTEMYRYLERTSKTAFVNPNDHIQIEKSKNIKNSVPFNIDLIELTTLHPFITISYKSMPIQTHLIGAYNFSNISAAITIGSYFKVSSKKIKEGLESYVPTNNRSQVLTTKKNTIVLDAYNANPTSMLAAIKSFNSIDAKLKTVILGDMFELGTQSEKEHQQLADYVASLKFDNVLLIGNLFHATDSLCSKFSTLKEATAFLKLTCLENQYILIKGSRGMSLELLLDAIN